MIVCPVSSVQLDPSGSCVPTVVVEMMDQADQCRARVCVRGVCGEMEEFFHPPSTVPRLPERGELIIDVSLAKEDRPSFLCARQ